MPIVTISSNFQIVIPRAVRTCLGLKVGQRVHVRANEVGQVVIEPDLCMSTARGLLAKISSVDIAHIENDLDCAECSTPAGARVSTAESTKPY